MDELVLEHPPDEARHVLQTAFESTREIQSYHDDGSQIVGKTGTNALSTSWGEVVVAEYRSEEAGTTTVALRAEPLVGTNVFANPERYRDRVREELDGVLGGEDPVEFADGTARSKRVPRADLQSGIVVGGKNYSVRRAVALYTLVAVLFLVVAAL